MAHPDDGPIGGMDTSVADAVLGATPRKAVAAKSLDASPGDMKVGEGIPGRTKLSLKKRPSKTRGPRAAKSAKPLFPRAPSTVLIPQCRKVPLTAQIDQFT